MTDTPPVLLTPAQLARAWGVSRQNIHALKRKGIIRPLESGLFDEAEARRAYLRNSDPAFRRNPNLVAGPVNQSGGSLDVASIRAVRASIDARMAKLKYQQRTGALIDADKVKLTWFNTLRMVRDRMLQLPDRLSAILAAETSPDVIRATVHAEIAAILNDAEKSPT